MYLDTEPTEVETSQSDLKKLVSKLKKSAPKLNTVFLVGCGGSMADLYLGSYFLQQNAKMLRPVLLNSNEFNYVTPASANENSLVVLASHSGSTPETLKAVKVAKAHHCHTLVVTHHPTSRLGRSDKTVVTHAFLKEPADLASKTKVVLKLCVELLNQYEGYKYYDKMLSALSKVNGLVDNAVKSVKDDAKKFAEKNKNAKVVYTVASGPNFGAAYSTSHFLLMEMQWIHSPLIGSAEFFHGPFEPVKKGTHVLLMMNEGFTRPMDIRVLEFLKKVHANYSILDSRDFGLYQICDIHLVGYLSPLLLACVARAYFNELAKVRHHPDTKRRYMWKAKY